MAQQPKNQQQKATYNCEICHRAKEADGEHNPLCNHIIDLAQRVAALESNRQDAGAGDTEKKTPARVDPVQLSDAIGASDLAGAGPGLEK